ncbi:hypothetical protein D3C75_1144650 [compost metagenome]
MRVEDQGIFALAVKRTESPPIVVETAIAEAVLELVTIVDVKAVRHGPVDQQVVVQREHRVEPFEVLVHVGQMLCDLLVLRVYAADRLY